MKIEFPPDMFVHILGVDTQWVDNMADDELYLLEAAINNGDFNAKGENKVTLRLAQKNTDPQALPYGGLMILSNLKKLTMRRAIVLGLQMLALNGGLSSDDYLGKGKQDGGETQHAN